MREACNILPKYQAFVRRSFQKQAKTHGVKITNSSSIRWKILFLEQDTTMSTIRTVSRSALTQTAFINDISEWEFCISNMLLMFGKCNVEDLFKKYKQLALEAINNSNDPFGIQEIASIKKKFSDDIKAKLEDILDDFTKEKSLFEAQKAINGLLVDIQDEQVFQIVKMVFSLSDEMLEEEVVISENHLTASFVHIIMKAVFKKDIQVLPHM
ncbi:hypothetical protein A0J61_01504 [Choanephora cucurbitarum]|uniref:Uncharacterized protein n=1 Tax=Choanephora cucurbitarum TaxID=101091 RepID=A0A1C7NMT1_9FUNG|nr:hypothetical protein A0J61_01504 [Choanephora cucurbitarum]